jgi:hypothetical protein
MGIPRTLGAVLAVSSGPTPVYTGTVIPAVTFSILNGVATIVLGPGNLPLNGYNGPNGYPTQNLATHSKFDIYGGINGSRGGGPAGGQQVTLWGFATATYFNGKVVSVIDCDPNAGSFRFYFAHADVASTVDTGNTAASPFQHYRMVRLECGQGLGSDLIYVGDLNVSSTRYFACLSLTGQFATEIASENIPADRIFILTNGSGSGDTVQVSLIY